MNAMNDTEIVQYVLRNRANYYKLLMVETTASTEQIKSAYKKMALRCHPDKNKHAQAVEAFKLIGTAHSTLSDETKRRIFDRQGADGVQRHENGGGRRAANGAGYGRRPPGQRDFFEEFFFGNAFQGGNGAAQGRRGAAGAGPRGHYEAEVNINPNVLLMIPLFLFLMVALLLQSTYTDIEVPAGRSGGAMSGRYRGEAGSFSLTPSPEEGFVVKRTTSLYGLRVPFYTTRRVSELMDRRKDFYVEMEQQVLRRQRDHLGKRCEAETFKHRTRQRKDVPEVCAEHQVFVRALG